MTLTDKINTMDSDSLDALMDQVIKASVSFENQYASNIMGARDENNPVDKGHFIDFCETGEDLIKAIAEFLLHIKTK